jgi:hypothetical protein
MQQGTLLLLDLVANFNRISSESDTNFNRILILIEF